MIKKLNKTQKEIQEKMLTLILAGFGLVTALAWNDAIQTMFKIFFPKSEGVIGKFIYAVMVTILVVIISFQLKKLKTDEKKKI